MAERRQFPLGDVLSITTGRLLSPQGIGGVYEILNFITGDNLYTHQLPRACDECKPHLLKLFPKLASVDTTAVTGDNWKAWLLDRVMEHGEILTIEAMAPGEHYFIDPVSELAEKVHPSRILVNGGRK
jgi:hypothetical protein